MQATWHHTAMAVQDMERAKRFYCDLLGFEIDWERPNYDGKPFASVVGMPHAAAHVVMLKGYGTRLELFTYYSPRGLKNEPKRQCDFGLTHFAFTVKRIHDIYDRLSSAGVEFNCPPQNLRPGVWGTYMKDPEGITIELVEYDES
jgi:catechol 2,3-dioxygenase-like lactoylglutathione lyase family enzyme